MYECARCTKKQNRRLVPVNLFLQAWKDDLGLHSRFHICEVEKNIRGTSTEFRHISFSSIKSQRCDWNAFFLLARLMRMPLPAVFFVRGALPRAKTREVFFQGLRRHFYYGSLKVMDISAFFLSRSNRYFCIFFVSCMHEVPSAVTPPRALQWNLAVKIG